MIIYDLTKGLLSAEIFRGDPEPCVKRIKEANEDGYNLSEVYMGTHTSTHVDAPLHFIEGGNTVDKLDLYSLCGRCTVVDVGEDADVLLGKVSSLQKRIILKGRSKLSVKLAEELVACGVKLIGLGALSVGNKFNVKAVHEVLLSAGVVIVENAYVTEIPEGEYDLYCLPLKIEGADGSPARMIAVKN